MRRRVVHLSDSTVFGGTEQALLDLMRAHSALGWEPHLLSLRAPGATRLVRAATEAGIPQQHWAGDVGWRGLSQVPALASLLRQWRPTVVHAHLSFPLACRFGVLAAAMARVPGVVVTAHLYVDLPRRSRAAWHVVRRCIDRHIAVSQAVARQWHEVLGVPARRIRVVPNTVHAGNRCRAAGAPPPGWPVRRAGQSVALTVARLDPQKGHATLLDALVRLPEVHLVLAGTGPERGALEALASILGVADRVTFLGERDDVRTLLRWADVVVLPSHYEGLPLALLEALHAGRPVVATAIGGIEDVVTDGVTGRLVPPGEATALAVAVADVLAHPVEAARLGAAGRARADAHGSPEAAAAAVVEVYTDACSRA